MRARSAPSLCSRTQSKPTTLRISSFFLELGADVEARLPAFYFENDGQLEPTPLLIAAYLDNIPLAHLLLEKGAKVEYFDRDGNGESSPMHAARSAEMVQLFLDHNADPNFRDMLDIWPLYWYAFRNDIAAMRAILQHGAQVNSIARMPWDTPLHEAAK
jgi:ankyrin repeat protein